MPADQFFRDFSRLAEVKTDDDAGCITLRRTVVHVVRTTAADIRIFAETSCSEDRRRFAGIILDAQATGARV